MRTPLVLVASSMMTLLVVAACSSSDDAPIGGSSSSSSGGASSSSSSGGGSSSSSSGSSGADASTDAVAEATVDAGPSMTFFVSSTPGGNGGNLGGLAGADAKCQALATAAGAGGKTWHAYLSVAGTNAKDRIGTGPWYNQKLKMIAANVAGLHTTNLLAADVVDEKGTAPPRNMHDILTGTAADGTAVTDTCTNWTSNAGNVNGFLGHSDSSTGRWNNAHPSSGCSAANLVGTGGNGRIYCFAIN